MTAKSKSGIGRPLSFKYPTNLAIITITLLSFLASLSVKLIAGDPFDNSIIWSFGFCASIFFSWALARELDPDNNSSAFIAVFLMFAVLLFSTTPSLLGLFWFLLMVRIISRIIGIRPTVFDLLIFITLSVILTFQSGWFYGLAAIISLYANSYFDGEQKKGMVLGLMMLVLSSAAVLLSDNYPAELGEFGYGVILSGAAAALFIFMSLKSSKVLAKTDVTDKPLSAERFLLARLTAVLTGLTAVLLRGNAGFEELYSLWAAVYGVLIWRIFKYLRRVSA